MPETTQIPPGPQRLRALEHANAIRLARAELKRRIADGRVSAADVILECPEAATRWTVAELLLAQRRWGSTRCRKFLERNGVSEIKPIGSLTERQRKLLAAELSGCPARTEPNLAAELCDALVPAGVDPVRANAALSAARVRARDRELAYA